MIDISSLIKNDLHKVAPSLIRQINNRFGQIPDIVNLTIGEPDFQTPDHIKLAAVQSILNNRTHYAPNRGTKELLTAISNYLASRFGLDYDPDDQIVVTNGASEAISTVFNGIIGPGDAVLISSPAFSLYHTLTLLNGGIPIEVDVSSTGFKLTPDVLDRYLTQYGDKIKMVVLNYPNNPTGVTYTPNEVRELAAVLRNYQVAILSDEVYSELAYFDEHVSIATYLPEQTLLVNSVSKSYAMTGWRIGYLCGDRTVIKELAKVHQANVATVGTPNMDAATEAFLFGDQDIRRMKGVYDRKRDYLCKALEKIGYEFVSPRGAFYIYVQVPKTFQGTAMAYAEQLAQDALVAVVPGEAFENGHSTYFRISYATSMKNLQLAVQRLAEYVKRQSEKEVLKP
ncbi:pyridoxal phosphate-dependent aminotransferase [Lentilactobacillus hilgardii]|uniref:pyridoxal phosphate-dependent aminotransferase n=1 Tax=Lentilactobacillus hilgardii TaxID=1588 RepID=UPI0021A4E653|nr:aminotransferase class I/II-fold pyridoxal phosphate-dependent enzyme [Lentilactobacillus hilgardii]MCT3398691.1 aminotransferase class I/II-fold pyridoxal phosphate-dependent enzyme [Lentilactobacillus hilgardii]